MKLLTSGLAQAVAFIIAVVYLPTTIIILGSLLIGRYSTTYYPYGFWKHLPPKPDVPESLPDKERSTHIENGC